MPWHHAGARRERNAKCLTTPPVAPTKAMLMRSQRLTLCVLLFGLSLASHAGAAPTITGAWTLDEKGSADPDKLFKGKLRRDAYPVPHMQSGGERSTPYDLNQLAYWETVRDGKEAHPSRSLRRLGIAYPMVKAVRLDIAEEVDGYRLTYDTDLPRSVRPNANGKVFSAKGDELVQDTFGFTLTYWDNDTLVVEADAPEGGKVIERLTVRENPHQLEYVVRVELRMLPQPVEVKRLFNPAGTH